MPAYAQLAQSFYNITDIHSKVVPNGVQVVIQTNGTVEFGIDGAEFLATDPVTGNTTLLATTSIRLRFVGARASVAAYTEVGAYPVDAVIVSSGQDELKQPIFQAGRDRSRGDPSVPRVDVTLRLFVPFTISNLSLTYNANAIGYTPPRQYSVVPTPDGRSVVVTFITDRTDALRGEARMQRSPAARQQHHLEVRGAATTTSPLRIDCLHTALGTLIDRIAQASGVPIATSQTVADRPVSLFLPHAVDVAAVLRSLALMEDLSVVMRSPEDGFVVESGADASLATERIALKCLAPDRARLLLPDFLLPHLHADFEHNCLIASGSPDLIGKIERDLALLDQPTPQVRIEAQVFEFQDERDAESALQISLAGGREAFDSGAGDVSVTLQSGQSHTYTAALAALIARGKAHLTAAPSLTVASGSAGTIFAGQTRYITVLQGGGYGPESVQALQLPIGVTFTATPTVCGGSSGGDITLDIAPQVSSIDSIDPKSGLPTIGTLQLHSVVCLQPGDTLLLSGLSTVEDTNVAAGIPALDRIPWIGPLFQSPQNSTTTSTLSVLITARVIPPTPAAADTVRPQTDAAPQNRNAP
jgi:type II secretory pathway component GspD/PulD (secretin)